MTTFHAGIVESIGDATQSAMTEGRLPVAVTGKTNIAIFLVIFCLALGFAVYTRHAWEDYYITYRSSKNLATGHGLVYTSGERIHTFTSPLGVLIPAFCCFATGNTSDALALWFFRAISAAALAGAAVILLRIARYFSMHWIPATFLIGMVAVDAKMLDFSINGMETGILLFFLTLTLNAMIVPGRYPVLKIGMAWAGLMWTRPDSFIYIAGLSAGFLLFRAGLYHERKSLLRLFANAAVVASILYLPWIAWTWHYFGSPIPNTVVAKGLNVHKSPWDLLQALLLYPLRSVFYNGTYASTFLPPYAGLGGWPHWLTFWSRALAWSSSMVWAFVKVQPVIRATSIVILLGGFYLDEISPFPYPWYLPTCTLLSVFVLAGVLDRLTYGFINNRNKQPQPASFSSVTGGLSAVVMTLGLLTGAALMVSAAYELRVQQAVIEDGNRKQIGLWLQAHAVTSRDTVFLEPVGYIGFFSQLKMLDFPGLCSREVIDARKRLGSDRAAGLIRDLKPDWLVLREAEVQRISSNAPTLLKSDYEPLQTFDVSDRISAYRWLPGRSYLEVDQTYKVFARRKRSIEGYGR